MDEQLTILHDDHNLTILLADNGDILLSLDRCLAVKLASQPAGAGRCELTIPAAAAVAR